MTLATDRVPFRIRFAHGLGSIAYGVKDNGFSTFLLLFYNQVIGVDAKLVSLALMLALFIDAFADPVIGHLSDKTYTAWGRRLPWLYLAPVPLGLAWLLMWTPPEGMGGNVFFYLLLVAILVRTLVSCCEVPSVALVPELTRDYDERTTLMRYRFLFGWGGGLVMLFLAYDFFLVPDETHAVGQLNPDGYWRYGLFGGLLIAASVILSALGQHRRVAHWPSNRQVWAGMGHAFGEIRESLSHRAFLVLMGAAALAYTSQGITFSISNYLYIFVWQFSKTAFQFYPVMLFVSVIASFLLVSRLHRRFGKREAAAACALVSIAFFLVPFIFLMSGLWPPVGSNASSGLMFVFFFVANSAGVMVMISSSSMIADIVEASEEQTGRRTEGTFFAGNFFMQKCATGLGIFVTGLIVSISGLPDKAQPGQVDADVISTMILLYCGVTLILAVLASLAFRRFPISREEHEARLAKLAARNATETAIGG